MRRELALESLYDVFRTKANSSEYKQLLKNVEERTAGCHTYREVFGDL